MDQADLNLMRQMRQVMAEWKRKGALVPSATGLSFDASQTGYTPRRLASYYDNATNVTTTETTLATLSVSANTLLTNGDVIVGEYGGEFVGHATATRQLKVKFGGSTIFDSGALAITTADVWRVKALVGRRSSSVATCIVSMTSETSQQTGGLRITSLDFTTALTLELTGQAAGVGAASSDITCTIGYVEYKPA